MATKKPPRRKTPAKKTPAKKTQAEQGKSNRRSGHDFERSIARAYRERFSEESWVEEIRRSDQGHGAALPDVTGIPGLWTECQHAGDAHWSPTLKLEQAIRDSKGSREIPVAVTRRKGHRSILATLRLRDLDRLFRRSDLVGDEFVTLGFDDFLDLFASARPWDGEKPDPEPQHPPPPPRPPPDLPLFGWRG